jgi:anti-sigma regulatory factor (Ser/Thr protein kinase)
MVSSSGESSSCRADGPALRIRLEQNPHAPALARAAVAGFSDGSDMSPARLATLLLLVSEVVTNAVIHSTASADITLCARLVQSGAVRVEVTDGGDGFKPGPRDPGSPDGGYGLYLVEQESVSWGVDREGGTRVWFELAA